VTRGSAALLVLPDAVRRALIADARRRAPRECCGFLLGRRGHVVCAVAMRNVARGHARYRVDSRQHLDLRRIMRGLAPALEIVGVYHSHPDGPPRPSPSDVAEAFYPAWVHVIVGLRGRPSVRAFSIRDGRVERVRLHRRARTGRRLGV
jgi:proteasome lid subunit RPN8/RPN11